MYNLTLTLVNTPADKGAEKSIENALRGGLLVVALSAIFSSLFSDKTFTHLVHDLVNVIQIPWGFDLGRSFQCCGPAHASTAA